MANAGSIGRGDGQECQVRSLVAEIGLGYGGKRSLSEESSDP